MYTVSFKTVSYGDDNSDEISVKLNPDQSLNPYTWHPPITWEGYAGNKSIKFIQTSNLAYSTGDFDWTGFPEKLDYLRNIIVAEIDKALRIMD